MTACGKNPRSYFQMTVNVRSLSLLLVLAFFGCNGPRTGPSGVHPLPPSEGVSKRPARASSNGQTLYVPCYSHVYLQEGRSYDLSITLSLRNTSRTESLVIQSVEFYDSAGKLLKHFTDHETVLGPLATTEYFLKESDPSGGSGANFLVTWTSDRPIEIPIVQALMVGTTGNIGVSFLTEGTVLSEPVKSESASSPTPTPPAR